MYRLFVNLNNQKRISIKKFKNILFGRLQNPFCNESHMDTRTIRLERYFVTNRVINIIKIFVIININIRYGT